MSSYDFFAAQLRFVAARTPADDLDVTAMMAHLTHIADLAEKADVGGTISVATDDLKFAGRALAGVAGFLQQHILPEIVAAENARGERQVRWVIDTTMELMAAMTVAAEQADERDQMTFDLPAPPDI